MEGWRKHQTHQEETAAVKAALRQAGIPFRKVGHGRGTACGWLKIFLSTEASYDLCQQAIRVAQEVTGRTGDYDGRINASPQ
mgnify:CR=1 FL=1